MSVYDKLQALNITLPPLAVPAAALVRRLCDRQHRSSFLAHWIKAGVALGLLLSIAFLAVSTWAAHRNRQYNMDRLYPPVVV